MNIWKKAVADEKLFATMLKDAMEEYGRSDDIDIMYVCTLVSASAGRYAGEELYRKFDYKSDCKLDDEFYYEELEEFINRLNDDLNKYLESLEFDHNNYIIYVNWNESDGAIDMFLKREEK